MTGIDMKHGSNIAVHTQWQDSGVPIHHTESLLSLLSLECNGLWVGSVGGVGGGWGGDD